MILKVLFVNILINYHS